MTPLGGVLPDRLLLVNTVMLEKRREERGRGHRKTQVVLVNVTTNVIDDCKWRSTVSYMFLFVVKLVPIVNECYCRRIT